MSDHGTGFGAEAYTALVSVVRELKVNDPLRLVTVLVPSEHVGVVARRALARGDGRPGVAAVRLVTVRRLADLLPPPDFARQQVELVRKVEGEFSVEGEWELDVHDDDVLESLLAPTEPDAASFATLASSAAGLAIAPPSADIRGSWGEDTTFAEDVPDEDWLGPDDE